MGKAFLQNTQKSLFLYVILKKYSAQKRPKQLFVKKRQKNSSTFPILPPNIASKA
jgi:hypothetical protein